MTDKEKAIIMAHTGICMLTGDKFQIFHKYVENIMGRPIMTHEIGWLADTIKEKSKADFIALCAEQEPCEDCISRKDVLAPYKELKDDDVISVWLIKKNIEQQFSVTPTRKKGKWIFAYGNRGKDNVEKCSCCDSHWRKAIIYRKDTKEYLRTRLLYCPNCGAKMESEE